MQLGETALYKTALTALGTLQQQYGQSAALADIARYLLYSNDVVVPDRLFPFVGDANNPHDRAVVEAYENAWQQFLNGDGDE